MRKGLCALTTVSFLLLHLCSAYAQNALQTASPPDENFTPGEPQVAPSAPPGKLTRIVITLAEAPADSSSIEWVNERDDEFSIRVPKALKPVLKVPVNVEMRRETESDHLIFSFVLQPGMIPSMRWRANTLEVVFASSNARVLAAEKGADERATALPHAKPGMALDPAETAKSEGGLALPLARAEHNTNKPGTAHFAMTKSGAAAGSNQAAGLTNLQNALGSSGNIKEANIDLSVPESPAFTVLGLTPETVVRPSSPQELVTSLLNGVDKNGNFQSGIAIDTVPYLLIAGSGVTLERYQKSIPTRLLSRTELSIASTKGASEDDKSARLAVGARLTVWDPRDPRLDKNLIDCIQSALAEEVKKLPIIPPSGPTPAMQAQLDAIEAQAKARVIGCRQTSRKDNWNGSGLTIGGAPSWISPTGTISDLKWNGGAVWSSLAYGFEGVPVLENNAQLIFHARRRTNEQVPDPDNEGMFLIQDTTFFGGRLRAGTPDFAFNTEYVYMRNKPEGQSTDTSYRISFGGERRIAKDLWFVVSLGGEGGRKDGKNNSFVLTSFKWNFSKEPTLGNAPR
jgi:hypothetical protein